MQEEKYLLLTIRNRGKGIPYGGSGVPREDGSANYGFKALKGKPEEAARIAEAQDNEHLKNALVAINDRDTPFFTVGCEKAFNKDDGSHWAKGYLELAFNYCDMVGDAQSYFKLFFEFNNLIVNSRFDLPVQYHFELEPAYFIDANCHGFTVAIWITTADLPTAEEAREAWGEAVNFLTDYLRQYPTRPLPTIY
jgi:hypothetical protein